VSTLSSGPSCDWLVNYAKVARSGGASPNAEPMGYAVLTHCKIDMRLAQMNGFAKTRAHIGVRKQTYAARRCSAVTLAEGIGIGNDTGVSNA
jgi:hypothetical protein